MLKFLAASALALGLFAATPAAQAHSYQQGAIQIGHIWARATAVGGDSATVYVPLLNTGATPDRLTGGSTPVAGSVMIHETTLENGISHMTMLDGLDLLPNQPVAMRPGSKHLMLTGLKQPLKEGDKFPLTLQFEHAGSATVEVMVHAAGAKSGNH